MYARADAEAGLEVANDPEKGHRQKNRCSYNNAPAAAAHHTRACLARARERAANQRQSFIFPPLFARQFKCSFCRGVMPAESQVTRIPRWCLAWLLIPRSSTRGRMIKTNNQQHGELMDLMEVDEKSASGAWMEKRIETLSSFGLGRSKKSKFWQAEDNKSLHFMLPKCSTFVQWNKNKKSPSDTVKNSSGEKIMENGAGIN